MTIDLNTYVASKQFVINWFNTKGNKDIGKTISMMPTATFVPCIVIAYWLGEETNWNEESVNAIKRLTDFYLYKTIKNKPANCPI